MNLDEIIGKAESIGVTWKSSADFHLGVNRQHYYAGTLVFYSYNIFFE